jgi:hypothetical protein
MSKTTTTTTRPYPKGITAMHRETHNYDGLIVRRTRHKHFFHQYVGAGARGSKLSDKARFDSALAIAKPLLFALDGLLDCPKSWRSSEGKKVLVKKVAVAIRELGFKIKSPAA